MAFVQDGKKGVLLLSKQSDPVTFSGQFAGWEGTVLEGVGPEPGYVPPRAVRVGAEGQLAVGAYGVAILWQPASRQVRSTSSYLGSPIYSS